MNHCKTCKHWEKLIHPFGKHESGECTHPFSSDTNHSDVATPNGFVIYAKAGYGPRLETGPEFGCVLHEQFLCDQVTELEKDIQSAPQ